jgi:hypothetical protein
MKILGKAGGNGEFRRRAETQGTPEANLPRGFSLQTNL